MEWANFATETKMVLKASTKTQSLEKTMNVVMRKEKTGMEDLEQFQLLMKSAELTLVVSTYALSRRFIPFLALQMMKCQLFSG